jgi:hypothetical protein
MNRGMLVERVGEKLAWDYDRTGIEQDLLQDLANEAVVDLLLRTHVYRQFADLTLTSGTAEYRLDANILAIDNGRGSTPSGIGAYIIVSLAEMIDLQSVDLVTSVHKYISIEGDLVIVTPTPSSGETLRFYYVPKPTVMSADTHDPSASIYGGVPTQYHAALEYYMLWKASERPRDTDRLDLILKPGDFFGEYERACKDIRVRLRRLRGRGDPLGRIGYPGSRRSGSRNDVYPYYSGRA